jgi:hypothetical protein
MSGRGARAPVRMVFEHQHEYPSRRKAIESIATKLKFQSSVVAVLVRGAQTYAGQRRGLATDAWAHQGVRIGESKTAPGGRHPAGGVGALSVSPSGRVAAAIVHRDSGSVRTSRTFGVLCEQHSSASARVARRGWSYRQRGAGGRGVTGLDIRSLSMT